MTRSLFSLEAGNWNIRDLPEGVRGQSLDSTTTWDSDYGWVAYNGKDLAGNPMPDILAAQLSAWIMWPNGRQNNGDTPEVVYDVVKPLGKYGYNWWYRNCRKDIVFRLGQYVSANTFGDEQSQVDNILFAPNDNGPFSLVFVRENIAFFQSSQYNPVPMAAIRTADWSPTPNQWHHILLSFDERDAETKDDWNLITDDWNGNYSHLSAIENEYGFQRAVKIHIDGVKYNVHTLPGDAWMPWPNMFSDGTHHSASNTVNSYVKDADYDYLSWSGLAIIQGITRNGPRKQNPTIQIGPAINNAVGDIDVLSGINTFYQPSDFMEIKDGKAHKKPFSINESYHTETQNNNTVHFGMTDAEGGVPSQPIAGGNEITGKTVNGAVQYASTPIPEV